MVVKEEKPDKNQTRRMDDDSQEAAEKNRIRNEISMLELIGHLENMNIARYFKDRGEGRTFKETAKIIMEYYPHKSLESFLDHHDHMSLNTKLWFLIQVANGLKFLVENGIYHLDLKPGNVMLTRNFLCKLIDFGESYCDKISTKTFRPGKTFPYAPPEVFQEMIKFNPKVDIFSFGVMTCEFLCDQMIVDYKKSNLNYINTRYLKCSYKTKLSDKIVIFSGPKHLMKLMRYYILFCTESTPDLRPSFEYSVVLLKWTLNFLDRMY